MVRFLVIAVLWALGIAIPAQGAEQAVHAFQCSPSSIEYHENGVLAKGKLREPSKIAGFPCRRWVRLHPNGALKQVELAESMILQGIEVPKGSNVFLFDDGTLDECWFSKDVTVQKLPCNGGGKISTRFHRNGYLKSCFLAKNTEIGGVPCKASLFVPATFHERGQLKSCLLAKDYTAGEMTYKRGSKVAFDEEGNVGPFKEEEKQGEDGSPTPPNQEPAEEVR